jgi:hypothetical protein
MSEVKDLTISSPIPYVTVPSAFQWVEYPMRQASDLWNQARHLETPSPSKLVTYAGAVIASWIAYPIMLCGAPLTMVADMVTGLVETGLGYYKGYNRSELVSILRIKVISSPVQHLTFLSVQALFIVPVTGAALIPLLPNIINPTYSIWVRSVNVIGALSPLLLGGSIFFYRAGQSGASQLPQWAQADEFSIFIDGGAEGELGWKCTYHAYKRAYKPSSGTPHILPQDVSQFIRFGWSEFHDQAQATKPKNIGEVENPSTAYDKYRNGFLQKKSPQELFELGDKCTKQDVVSAFRRLAFSLHSNKNLQRVEEADFLFTSLCHARLVLEQAIDLYADAKGICNLKG